MNDNRHDVIGQWRKKAMSDWTTVEILLDSEKCPTDVVCFHCQQFTEKLLKAVLTHHGVEAPRIHDVRRLIQLAEPFIPRIAGFSESSDLLTVHSVEARYPGDINEIDHDQMNEIVKLAKEFGDILLTELDK